MHKLQSARSLSLKLYC